jgi:hypothetical protein
MLHYSKSIVSLPRRHPRGAQLREGRRSGGTPIARRWMVGSRGDGEKWTARPGAKQLFAAR